MSTSKDSRKGQVAIARPACAARHLRGQVATEFFLYSAVFMFIVISAFLIVSYIQSTEVPAREYAMVKETGETFSGVLALAVRGGEGFSYNFTFPRKVLGKAYTVTFEPNEQPFMIAEWPGSYGNFSYSYPIPAYEYQYSGCICKGGGECKAPFSTGDEPKIISDKCSGSIMLENDGTTLKITQVA